MQRTNTTAPTASAARLSPQRQSPLALFPTSADGLLSPSPLQSHCFLFRRVMMKALVGFFFLLVLPPFASTPHCDGSDCVSIPRPFLRHGSTTPSSSHHQRGSWSSRSTPFTCLEVSTMHALSRTHPEQTLRRRVLCFDAPWTLAACPARAWPSLRRAGDPPRSC